MDKEPKGKDKSGKFISMPGEAIDSLRTELSNLLGQKLASGALFRFGFKCGEAMTERLASDISKKKGLGGNLPVILGKTGLGKIVKIEEISENELAIELENSTEANFAGSSSVPTCDYTRGYLAGIASILTKKKFYGIETNCTSEGKDRCIFQLVVFPHRVYVPKEKS